MLKTNNDSGKETSRAALFFMRGLDHSLNMIGGGLATFKLDNLVPCLKPSEKRYLQPRKRPLDGVPEGVTQLKKLCMGQ